MKLGIREGFSIENMISHLNSLNNFFDKALTGIQIYDKKGKNVYANNYSLKIFGVQNSQEIKKIQLFKDLNISNSKIQNLQSSETINEEIYLDLDSLKEKDLFCKKNGKLILDLTIRPLKFEKKEEECYLVHIIDVTERRKSEADLKENEVRFRNIVENSMEGIFIVDDSYKFVYANRELSRILGYPLEEIINNDFRNFLDEESLNKVVGRYKKRQRGERVVPRYEFNIIKKSGEKRRLEMISTATRELRGGVKTIAQVLDITEQKKTIEKLKESEEKFKNLAEQSLISIIILQDDRVKYANQQFGKGIGYPLDEIRNWSLNELSQIVHPKDRDFVAEQARKKQKGMDDIVPKYEFRIITKDGDIVWRELYSNTITYQGKTADLITLVDISEKKISEQKLKESEKKFRGIFEAIPDIFFLITSDSTIIDYKGKKEDLFLPPESFLNKRMVDLLPESTAKVLCLKIKNAINSKEPQIMEYKLKLNEEIRNFEARILYYSEEQFAVFIRDITKRKKAEKILKEEVRRLREIDKIRRDLISRVSHELKTPIMAISGATELLDMYEKDLNQEGQGLIKMIQSNQKRLDHLINNLLDISRADYKQINLNLEKIDISSLIREITSEMNILKENRKISLKLDLPDTLYLDLDKLRIEQVIMNLLSNAIKNTPPKGEIKISVHQQNECVEIKVEDTGVGLTSEEMKKLFTKFGKIERYGEGLEYLDIRGSGLGLFISNEIIKLHEGSIRVHSPGRNKGSLFTIVLPKIKYK